MKRLQALLGFAAKAGALVNGSAAVEAGIKQRKIELVICATDLSPKTIKNFDYLCKKYEVGFYCFGNIFELGYWVGSPGRGVIGVTSKQFAGAIGSLFNVGGEHH